MSAEEATGYSIEPLHPDHDRQYFTSGVPELDLYFQRQVGQDVRRKVAAAFVLLRDKHEVLGYYTLSAYSVRVTELSESLIKRLPRYPLLPATLLGRLAIHQTHQGKGFGKLLLMDALYRSLRNTTEIASVGVVVDAYDDNALAFYKRYDFIPLLDHSHKLFLPMGTIEKLFA